MLGSCLLLTVLATAMIICWHANNFVQIAASVFIIIIWGVFLLAPRVFNQNQEEKIDNAF